MILALDTNVVIEFLRRRPSGFDGHLFRAIARGDEIAVTAIVVFELWYGAALGARPKENIERMRSFVDGPITIWPFEAQDAEEAGELRAALTRAGTQIGPYDILIAAQARRRGASLVTGNIREFSRVPGLRLIDWSR